MAQNTLSHRILGPNSTATIELDYSTMIDGDRAGLVVFRYNAGWIGVSKNGTTTTLQMVDNILMDPEGTWHTIQAGEVITSTEISGGSVWLRVNCDINVRPANAKFYFSNDGENFTEFGQTHETLDGAVYFVGNRYGVFNYATKALGGQVVVTSFKIST